MYLGPSQMLTNIAAAGQYWPGLDDIGPEFAEYRTVPNKRAGCGGRKRTLQHKCWIPQLEALKLWLR